MANKQWSFFTVSRLLWQGTSVHKSYLQGHVTFNPVAELSTVELSLPTLRLRSRLGIEQPTFHRWSEDSNRLRYRLCEWKGKKTWILIILLYQMKLSHISYRSYCEMSCTICFEFKCFPIYPFSTQTTNIIDMWTGCTVICCHGKRYSHFWTTWVVWSLQ